MEGTYDCQPRYANLKCLTWCSYQKPEVVKYTDMLAEICSFYITDFKDNPYIYAFDSLKYIGIELWQVGAKCCIIFSVYSERQKNPLMPIFYICRLSQELCLTTF
jgi:hypothetical protein